MLRVLQGSVGLGKHHTMTLVNLTCQEAHTQTRHVSESRIPELETLCLFSVSGGLAEARW